MQTETFMRAMADLLVRIAAHADFSLTSSPAAFHNTIVSWLSDPNSHLPNGRIVGLCCSSLLGLQFREEGNTTPSSTVTDTDDFRLLLLAASLAHASWRDTNNSRNNTNGNSTPSKSLQTPVLNAAGHIPGCYRLLKRLDRVLTPQFLSRLDRESCQVLFLLALSAVLGVGYSTSHRLEDHHCHEVPATQTMLSPEFQRSPTLWLAMKEYLCQMLAHHFIFLGSMLGIRIQKGLEQRIADMAAARWKEAEELVWADVVGLRGDELGQAEPPGVIKSEDGDGRLSFGSLAPPPPPRLMQVAGPEIRQFRAQTAENWSENPRSYLAMCEEPETLGVGFTGEQSRSFADGGTSPPSTRDAESKPQRHATSEPRRRPEKKRRSIWLVRPFDAGPEHGLVSVHARLKGGTGMESLRAFV